MQKIRSRITYLEAIFILASQITHSKIPLEAKVVKFLTSFLRY